MVVILMYVAIRSLICITDRAKKIKQDIKKWWLWLKALITLVVMHIIMYTVIAFNTDIN